jgi:cadmium resistance protein CadD (predicted permease)
MDRRALFFLGAALVSFALVPVGLEKYRHVAVFVGCVYIVLGLLSLLDSRGRSGRRGRRSDR